jgi:hypothetical protein
VQIILAVPIQLIPIFCDDHFAESGQRSKRSPQIMGNGIGIGFQFLIGGFKLSGVTFPLELRLKSIGEIPGLSNE